MSEAGNSDDWWRGCVIYQIYPRSFQDSTGDGSGDLDGIAARLPHVASLGVDAVWLSPFFKSPMADMGYDVSDYTAVDPMFGSIEDFDRLVAEAHRLGLKVDHRPGAVAHLRPTRLVSGKPRQPRQPQGGLVRLGQSQAGWHCADQLAVGVRRPGLGMGRHPQAILHAQFPGLAAGSQLSQS